jgi:hypothetical protein
MNRQRRPPKRPSRATHHGVMRNEGSDRTPHEVCGHIAHRVRQARSLRVGPEHRVERELHQFPHGADHHREAEGKHGKDPHGDLRWCAARGQQRERQSHNRKHRRRQEVQHEVPPPDRHVEAGDLTPKEGRGRIDEDAGREALGKGDAREGREPQRRRREKEAARRGCRRRPCPVRNGQQQHPCYGNPKHGRCYRRERPLEATLDRLIELRAVSHGPLQRASDATGSGSASSHEVPWPAP